MENSPFLKKQFLLGIITCNSINFLSMTSITERDANRMVQETNNRSDEWKIEQGMAASKLPIIDQTREKTVFIYPVEPHSTLKNTEAIEAVGDRNRVFSREIAGWKGYRSIDILNSLKFVYQ